MWHWNIIKHGTSKIIDTSETYHKDKSKSFPSKNFVKKRVPNDLAAQERKVEEEYMSSDEDVDEVVGVAHVAITTSSSSPSSLFKSPNKNADHAHAR